jgi:ATP-dependent Clp protease protease subunit
MSSDFQRQTQNFYLSAKHTGHDLAEIEKAFEHDRHMQALEAKAFGLVDEVLGDTGDIVAMVDGHVQVPGENGSRPR